MRVRVDNTTANGKAKITIDATADSGSSTLDEVKVMLTEAYAAVYAEFIRQFEADAAAAGK